MKRKPIASITVFSSTNYFQDKIGYAKYIYSQRKPKSEPNLFQLGYITHYNYECIHRNVDQLIRHKLGIPLTVYILLSLT